VTVAGAVVGEGKLAVGAVGCSGNIGQGLERVASPGTGRSWTLEVHALAEIGTDRSVGDDLGGDGAVCSNAGVDVGYVVTLR
jgi:hypothetical protein